MCFEEQETVLKTGLFQRVKWASAAVLAGSVLFSGSVFAEKVGDWAVNCEQDHCQAGQQLFVTKDEQKSRVLSASLMKVKDQLVMQMVLPLGVDLRSGIVTRVDENKELHFPFITCVRDGCVTLVPVKGDLISQMKAGNKMKVGFRPFRSEQTLVVELSLSGFTKASTQVR